MRRKALVPTLSHPRNLDQGGRLGQDGGADGEDLALAAACLADVVGVAFEFLADGGTLHGDHRATHFHQGQGPARELAQRSDRAGGDDVRGTGFLLNCSVLGAPTDDGDVLQVQLFADFAQVRGTLQQRLDESDAQVGAGDRQGDAGEAGAGSDVDDVDAFIHGLADDGAVEDVAIPEARDFARTDEATLRTGRRE